MKTPHHTPAANTTKVDPKADPALKSTPPPLTSSALSDIILAILQGGRGHPASLNGALTIPFHVDLGRIVAHVDPVSNDSERTPGNGKSEGTTATTATAAPAPPVAKPKMVTNPTVQGVTKGKAGKPKTKAKQKEERKPKPATKAKSPAPAAESPVAASHPSAGGFGNGIVSYIQPRPGSVMSPWPNLPSPPAYSPPNSGSPAQ